MADSSRRWGLLLTLTGGALALIGFGAAGKASRGEMAAVGTALFAVFVWGIGWAVYCALGAPDIFLGGVALERLVRPPSSPAAAGRFVLMLVPAAGLASFFASSVSLRERIGFNRVREYFGFIGGKAPDQWLANVAKGKA